MPYALIIADVNSDGHDDVVSTHRTLRGAGRAYRALDNARFSYIAARRADGSYPARMEALELNTHSDALEAARQ